MKVTTRLIRIVVSLAALGVLTGGLAYGGMQLPGVAGWLVSVQLLPAVAAFSLITFVVWLSVTLIFGRVYCSTVCPLGTVMDIFGFATRLPRRDGLPARESRRYRYTRPRTTLRYLALVGVLTCLIGGFMTVPSLVDPYTIYERLCVSVIRPVWSWISGHPCETSPAPLSAASAYPPLMIGMSAMAGALISLVTIGVVGYMAALNGRTLCNTLCPVGTTLGMISRYSIFQMDIDTDLCTQCRRCEDACKGGCIDLNDHTVDGSRCVVCFDCTAVCPVKAIRYTASRKQLSIPMMQRVDGDREIAGQPTAMTGGVSGNNEIT